jgi:hypothetical protein
MNPVRYLETSVIICGETYEVIWGDEAEVRSFEDRWKGGIHHYIDWMQGGILEMHRVLKSTGAATAMPLPDVDQMLADIYEGVRLSLPRRSFCRAATRHGRDACRERPRRLVQFSKPERG